MTENRLRRLLDTALVGEPPVSSLARDALRRGIELRRRRRALTASVCTACVAAVAAGTAVVTGAFGGGGPQVHASNSPRLVAPARQATSTVYVMCRGRPVPVATRRGPASRAIVAGPGSTIGSVAGRSSTWTGAGSDSSSFGW